MKKLLALLLMLGSMTVMAKPVNVNTADAATIADALHGIGLKKAQQIVLDREKNGAFKSLEDLGRVKGIGDKTLAKNKADILFDGAGASAAPAAAPTTAPAATPFAPAAAPAAAAPKAAKDVKASVPNPLK
jgi:competence protein ComEA